MTEKNQKKSKAKYFKQGYTRVLFHYRDKFPLCDLVQGQAPKPQQQQKQKE
jgi:hypothetical protein